MVPALSCLTPEEDTAIQSFLQKLRENVGEAIEQTILFGSKARGDSEPDSDIDILIIVENETWPLKEVISLIAARVSLEHGVLLGPRVIGAARWEEMRRERFSFYQNIDRDGVPLVAA